MTFGGIDFQTLLMFSQGTLKWWMEAFPTASEKYAPIDVRWDSGLVIELPTAVFQPQSLKTNLCSVTRGIVL